jgi:hypothetical protein
MNIKKLALSLFTACVLAASPMSAFALSNYTLNGNYVITGDLYVDSLLGHVGQCLEVGTGPLGASEIVATGSPCGGGGGGGVTSVTSANDLIAIAPNTGAVIVTGNEAPTFTGIVTANSSDHYNPGFETPGMIALQYSDISSNNITIDATGSYVSGMTTIANNEFGIINSHTSLLSLDQSGNLGIAGTYFSSTLYPSVGDCLEVGTNGSIVSTGSACAAGGGAVTSVTAGPSGNLTFAPTTGAVVGDIVAAPTFTGNTTVGSLTSAGAADVGSVNASGAISGATLLGTGLTSGDCVQASTGGLLTTTGAACGPTGGFPTPQTLHGNQSITAVAAACTPGTPIVFAHTFSAVPDIIMSTSAVVGDTAAPETGTITTTGFTPEICSVASAATATVYWQAVN